MKRIEDYIISVPDFPKPGILFRDVTGILGDADGLKLTLESLYKVLEDVEFDVVAGLEARGFLFGVSVAEHFHKPFVPVRKKGKLPRETVEVSYDLEYGQATMEIHKDSISDAAAFAVPPVASRSSTIITRCPGLIESLWISMVA